MEHDLSGLLKSPCAPQLRQDQAKCYMKQLLEGLHYMHKNNILHRDIKAANLLVNNQGILKLADFGLARPMTSTANHKYTNKVITLWYRPPELLLGTQQYGPSVDMWSTGCILAELLEKRALFEGDCRERTELQQLELIWEIVGTPNDENWPQAKTLRSYVEPKKTK
eukprot:TRINITY_DN7323_c0_g1_i2.p1 TRINITY_DN7323_c0_g1~~TRINITY_DN7323_c0_g1_i2.p1  ORF type:complete len:167 (-),score=40.84 TRINITY_DN7323_c0_g1_i2:214-714(-)